VKAITFQGIKDVKVKEVKDPTIMKPDDIVIKVTSTAICGSDLHLVHGTVPHVPKDYVIGHETMGIVEEVGKEVTKVKKGDRVIVPFPISCGHCWHCQHDEWSQCDESNPNGTVGGIFGYGENFGAYDGGQAEYLRVPYANVGPTMIPEDMTDEQVLFLTDILPTAYWGALNANIKPGDTVAVLGCGPVGLLAQKWAKIMGAGRIIAVDNIDYRLEHARTKNKVEALNFNDYEDTGEAIYEMTKGGVDSVIDCVGMDGNMTLFEKVETALKLQGGSKSAIEMAAKAVRKSGVVSFLGVYGARYNMFPFGDFFSKNITMKMGQCPVHSYVDPIMNMIREQKIDPTDIITHILPLSKGEHAYQIFDKKQDNCIKVILKP
jgi:S-(hydroxymethyl)glutathione dehydrogenase / alcohol dehydrogenase